jgi:glycosyltransferase involved in cell wall biosynthesis
MDASGAPLSSYESENRITRKRIGIVTPAPPGSRRGNRITAERWARLLTRLGHDVEVIEHYSNQPFDILVVLHAARGADAIRRFRQLFPRRPLIIAVTGTDIYGEQFDPGIVAESLTAADRIVVLQARTAADLADAVRSKVRVIYGEQFDPGIVAESLTAADRIVVLQARTAADLADAVRSKVRVIFQSALPPTRREAPRDNIFEVAVVGHLRPVKDPFRAAEASRLLAGESLIHIVHLGEAMSEEMAEHARHEAAKNPRYKWLGDLSHDDALATMSRCRLVVLTSRSEGGPAVIPEAIVMGVPLIATRVAGCIGMLGDDYPGLFPVGDTTALASLLWRAERDGGFYQELVAACDRLRPLFRPDAETAAWRSLLAEF